jgi:nondiscriminating aspartyl-tRNA synthetase
MESQPRTLAKDCVAHVGEIVSLLGWVQKSRNLGQVSFVLLRDRSGTMQCVFEHELADVRVNNESVVSIVGEVIATDKTSLGIEVNVQKLVVLNEASPTLAFEVNKKDLNANLDVILDNRVLAMRNEKVNQMLKIKSSVVHLFTDFLTERDFTQIFTPKIVSMGAEGGSNIFGLDYFGQKAYLAQSPQFYKQMMVISGLERVFEVGPVFRAEEHNSSRHLNEYTSLDVEMGFIESVQDLMDVETELLAFVFTKINQKYGTELPEITTIPAVSVKEAQQILLEKYKKKPTSTDLDSESEKLIAEHIKKTTDSDFVFITRYPKEHRPMYTMGSKEDERVTESFDLLYKGLEITSGSQRIHDYGELKQSFVKKGLNLENFKEYFDAFQLGVPPHGGFAIGLERLVAKMLNFQNVRETTSFPRDCNRLTP